MLDPKHDPSRFAGRAHQLLDGPEPGRTFVGVAVGGPRHGQRLESLTPTLQVGVFRRLRPGDSATAVDREPAAIATYTHDGDEWIYQPAHPVAITGRQGRFVEQMPGLLLMIPYPTATADERLLEVPDGAWRPATTWERAVAHQHIRAAMVPLNAQMKACHVCCVQRPGNVEDGGVTALHFACHIVNYRWFHSVHDIPPTVKWANVPLDSVY